MFILTECFFAFSDNFLKSPLEKESVGIHSSAGLPPGSGVYVIEEHFHRPDALHPRLFATEV